MKLFKTVDEKFKEIGFTKVIDDDYGATYERKDGQYNYTQVLDIRNKANGRHIVQSYDKHLMDKGLTGNICVGLTYYEIKLALKKMKEKGWKSK